MGYMVEFKEPTAHRWTPANAHLCKDLKYKIEGLRDRGEYEFRVFAKNAAGLSKPSDSSGIIRLKPKYGPPGPPGMPRAESIGRKHVTLTWDPPILDGGSKVTGKRFEHFRQIFYKIQGYFLGYIVERREVGPLAPDAWIVCNDYNVRDPEFTVSKLIEFKDYEFRVVAVNSHGRGDPSQSTSPIKIQEMGGSKPEIVRKPMDASSPLNKRVIFECEAIGRPVPTCRW